MHAAFKQKAKCKPHQHLLRSAATQSSETNNAKARPTGWRWHFSRTPPFHAFRCVGRGKSVLCLNNSLLIGLLAAQPSHLYLILNPEMRIKQRSVHFVIPSYPQVSDKKLFPPAPKNYLRSGPSPRARPEKLNNILSFGFTSTLHFSRPPPSLLSEH